VVMSFSVRGLNVVRNTILTSPEGGMATPFGSHRLLRSANRARGPYCQVITVSAHTGLAPTATLHHRFGVRPRMRREPRDQEPDGPAISAFMAAIRAQSPNGADKTVDPIAAEDADQRAATCQVMQMGERLAQRKRHLMPVEGPSE